MTENFNEQEEIILNPDPARVMEGLRDTGYDFNTAMADIVDNSIAANATLVKVNVTLDPNDNINVTIADNGCGMDLDGLKNAMRYGSARRANASSLGKFGLGLKTASTAFCRSLSLLSKSSDSDYHKVCWDLDYVCQKAKWVLLQPDIKSDEIIQLEEVTNGNSGTLVIWDKVDRLMKSYSRQNAKLIAFNKIIDKLRQHFAMVYQRYIDPNFKGHQVEIYLNDSKVLPWDPFCENEPKTKILAEDRVGVELPSGEKAFFHIKAYLLPRKEEFSTPETRSAARVSNDMEGFYVYREDRLIHYGGWLGMFVSDPHISLLRVSFSFDHELDDAFNVDIKKSRIMLNEDIYNWILDNFLQAPKREAESLYRKGRTEEVEQKSKNAHESSNNNIESKAKSLENAKVTILDQETGKVQIQNQKGTFTGTIKIQSTAYNPGEYRVVPVDDIEAGCLWEPRIVEGKQAVAINRSHEYYSKIYARLLDQPTVIQGLDSLLWALAATEFSTYNDEVKDNYTDLRILTSQKLKRLVNDLPDPDVEV